MVAARSAFRSARAAASETDELISLMARLNVRPPEFATLLISAVNSSDSVPEADTAATTNTSPFTRHISP